MRTRLTSYLAALLVAVVWWGGCASDPGRREPVTIEPSTHTPGVASGRIGGGVPVPSGLEPKDVQPYKAADLKKAAMHLEQVVAALPRPGYLPAQADDAQDERQPDFLSPSAEAEPPLAAQHAYLIGRQAWLERQNFEAIRHLQAAQRLAPRSAQVLRLLGRIYMGTGNRVRAGTYLEKAVEADARDVESLFWLGRLASEQGRWDETIVTLAYAAGLKGQGETDSAMGPLIEHFLGQALAHEGYDQAAVERLGAFLTQSEEVFDRTTGMARLMALLDRQRDATWQTVGDAYNRLNRAAEALEAYRQAARLQQPQGLSSALARRLVYTAVRLGRDQDATDAALDYVRDAGADGVALGLIRYLSDRGVDRTGLVGAMRAIYEQSDRVGALAIAIAELSDPASAGGILSDHLLTNPSDRVVFEHLARLHAPGKALADRGLGGLLETTIKIIESLPSAAQEYAAIFLDAIDDPSSVLSALGSLPEATRQRPMARFVAAKTRIRLGQTDQALEQLRLAVADDADLAPPRIELARLLVEQGDVDQADQLLEALSDHGDMDVVRLKLSIMLRRGQVADAAKFIDGLMAQHPSNTVELVVEKAKLYLTTGDAQQAHTTLREALKNYPSTPLLYEWLIRLYRSNQLPDAQGDYKQVVEQMLATIPHTKVARTERARLLLASKRYDQAEPLLRGMIEQDPDDLNLLDPLLLLLTQTDRAAQADEMIESRLAKMPNDRQLLTVALQHYRRQENQKKQAQIALRLFTDLLSDQPRNLNDLNLLINILAETGQRRQAESLLHEQLDAQPEDPGLLALAQQHYTRVNDPDKLFEVTERLLFLRDPGPVRAYTLAKLYRQHKKPGKAVEVLTGALEDPGEYADVLVNALGQALIDIGRPGDADGQYRDLIKRFPQHAVAFKFGWAMQCDRRGDKQRAEGLLLDVLKDTPDHALANNALGYSWADKGQNLQRAKEMISLALEADPDSAAYLDSMGWVLYKLGRFNEAVTWLQRATAAPGGEYPVILDHLGDGLYRVGRHDMAASMWRQAQTVLSKEDAREDPELVGMADRLGQKLQAVKDKQPVGVADAPGAPQEELSQEDPDEEQPSNLPAAAVDQPGDRAGQMEEPNHNQPPPKPLDPTAPPHTEPTQIQPSATPVDKPQPVSP